MNRFCVTKGLVCNIINEVGGTPQQKITTASLNIVTDGKSLSSQARATNKKMANALCALEMIAQLIGIGQIEPKSKETNPKPIKRKVDDVGKDL